MFASKFLVYPMSFFYFGTNFLSKINILSQQYHISARKYMLRVFQVDLDVTPILGTHNLDIQINFAVKTKTDFTNTIF